MPLSDPAVALVRPYTMWSGSRDDLVRLLLTVERLYAPLMPQHIGEQTRFVSRSLARARERLQHAQGRSYQLDSWADDISTIEETIAALEKELEEATEIASRASQIRMVVSLSKNDQRTFTGRPSELVEFLDGKQIANLDFYAPSGSLFDYTVQIYADRSWGVRLRVNSSDKTWGLSAMDELRLELERRTPRFRAFRNGNVLFPVFYVPTIIVCWLFGDLFLGARVENGNPSASAVWTSVLYSIVSLVIANLATVGVRAYVPAFDLYPPGAPSRAQRALKVARWFVGSLLVTVVGAWVSNVVLG